MLHISARNNPSQHLLKRNKHAGHHLPSLFALQQRIEQMQFYAHQSTARNSMRQHHPLQTRHSSLCRRSVSTNGLHTGESAARMPRPRFSRTAVAPLMTPLRRERSARGCGSCGSACRVAVSAARFALSRLRSRLASFSCAQ